MLEITKTHFQSPSNSFSGASIMLQSKFQQCSIQSELAFKDTSTQFELISKDEIDQIFTDFLNFLDFSGIPTTVIADNREFYNDIRVICKSTPAVLIEIFNIFRDILDSIRLWRQSEILRLDSEISDGSTNFSSQSPINKLLATHLGIPKVSNIHSR